MFHWRRNQAVQEQAAEYATRKDFQKIFTEEMAGLHLLAFLLTADQDKAEQCFVAGLEESIRGNPVFKQWARSWSKRAIIKNAIKAVSPSPRRPAVPDEARGAPAVTRSWNGDSKTNALIAAVTHLHPFDRFVLVMTVLEGYSVRECSALLGCPSKEVAAAKSQALEQLGSLATSRQATPASAALSWASFLAPTQLA